MTNLNATMVNYIDEVADIILQTRDFCGNVNDAIKEWESENVRLTAEERAAAIQLAQQRWKDCKNR